MNKPACRDVTVVVNASDCPLSCPMPGQTVWNAHPKVYLPILKTHREVCPYCGTIYVLEGHASTTPGQSLLVEDEEG